MKKYGIRLFFSVIIVFILMFNLSFNIVVNAVSSQLLISVGTGNYYIEVTTTTTIDDIKKVLGEPKLTTPSAFGGNAYTFYTDDNYSNYLYIETTKDEKIFSFGSVDPSYKTSRYSYGDAYNYYENGVLHGCITNVDGVNKGAVYYNKTEYDFEYSNIYPIFENNYKSDEEKYLKGLSQQAILMYNAFSTQLGYKVDLKFDEEIFYINEQLKEFGSSIREYAFDVEKTNYMKGMGIKENKELHMGSYYIMNPMEFASLAISNRGSNYGDKLLAVFDYDTETKLLSAISINEELFKRYDEIELTAEEKTKLLAGREKYKQAKENLYKEDGLYDIEPQSTEITSLTAGELKQSKKQGITDYVNAIRLAAGLGELTLDEDAFEVAQHISTLISYRLTELNLPIQHYPPKPDGLSDEYYDIAVRNMKGFAENLGYANMSSTEKTMMRHINLFLNDGSENPMVFSHRAKILDPGYTKFGYGISPYTFGNEFGGTRKTNVFLEAWPAKGITFLESLDINGLSSVDRKFNWTARFLDNYTVTDNTTVTVKCLNTGDTWNFTEEVGDKNSSVYFKRYTDSIQSINNKVVFYNSEIVPEEGYVYEITVHGLTENSTSKEVDYTYRSVFEYADEENYQGSDSSLTIEVDETNMQKVEGKENTYTIPLGQEIKLNVKENTPAKDNKVTWTSSNENVTVTQNGKIVANGAVGEEVTISVSYDSSNNGATIKVIPTNPLPDDYKIQLNYTKYQINSLNEKLELKDENLPSNLITWTSTREDIATVDSNGIVTPKAGGFTYIKATTKDYGSTECWVYVCALRTLRDGSKVYPGDLDGSGNINANDSAIALDYYKYGSLTEDEIAVADINGDGRVNANDSAIITDIYVYGTFTPGKYTPITSITLNKTKLTLDEGQSEKLRATITPVNTTDSPNITWKSSNDYIVKVDENGNVTSISGGTATITATSSNGLTATCDVTSNAPIATQTITGMIKSAGDEKQDIKIELLQNTTIIKEITLSGDATTYKIEGVPFGEYILRATRNNVTVEYEIKIENIPIEKDIEIYLRGDINNDGKITIADLNYGLKRLTGIPLTEDEIRRGDITDDGKYTIADLNKMLKYLNKVIDEI